MLFLELFEFGDGVDFFDAKLFDACIVSGWDFLLFHFVKDDGELGFFASEFLDVVGWEGDFEGLGFVFLHASDGLFEARDEGMGAKDKGVVVGFAAFEWLEVASLIWEEAIEVDGDGVAHLGFTLDEDELGVVLETLGHCRFDFGVGDGIGWALGLKSFVSTEFGAWDGDDGIG